MQYLSLKFILMVHKLFDSKISTCHIHFIFPPALEQLNKLKKKKASKTCQ